VPPTTQEPGADFALRLATAVQTKDPALAEILRGLATHRPTGANQRRAG
jgi:hypothetical protein